MTFKITTIVYFYINTLITGGFFVPIFLNTGNCIHRATDKAKSGSN